MNDDIWAFLRAAVKEGARYHHMRRGFMVFEAQFCTYEFVHDTLSYLIFTWNLIPRTFYLVPST